MIAEIKGKISSTGSNLSDRLEDKLTGDFFGTLRYIPFNKAMKNILTKTKIIKKDLSNIIEIIKKIDIDYWDGRICFWPYDSLGELDVIIEFEDILIGIEVKLHSGLSSDDGVVNSDFDILKESDHQLSRESRILRKKVIGSSKQALLIFIAPEYNCYLICKDAYDRNIIEEGVILGYLSWEEILISLERLINTEDLNNFEKLIIQDLMGLLKRKGLERFKNFDLECENINPDLWFEFNTKKDIDIHFNIIQSMIKEGYYEFR